MESDTPTTKKCPFCAETIQAAAVKCRFCGEFFGPAPQTFPRQTQNPPQAKAPKPSSFEKTLFKGRPSLWALMGSFFKALFFLAVAALLVFYPLENLQIMFPNLDLAEPRLAMIDYYAQIAGAGLAFIVLLIFILKTATLKSTHYEVTPDRIEWQRGIFSRKIDNLDMFRVIDLKLHRSLLDCVLGIGTVTLVTKDQTDPEFEFKKVRYPRILYDILKKASLDADRKQGVIHIE